MLFRSDSTLRSPPPSQTHTQSIPFSFDLGVFSFYKEAISVKSMEDFDVALCEFKRI